MDENSTFIAIITINACIIPFMMTVLFIRSIFFQEKLDNIEIKKQEYIHKIMSTHLMVNQKYYQFEEYEKTYDSIVSEVRKEEIDFRFLLYILNEAIFYLMSPTAKDETKIGKCNIQEIRSISQKINTLKNSVDLGINTLKNNIEKMSEDQKKALDMLEKNYDFSKLKIKKYDTLLNQIIESLIREDLVKEQKNKFKMKKTAFLITYQSIIGISFPLILISTLPYKYMSFDIIHSYDLSTFVGLTLGVLSLLPYVYYAGKQLVYESRTSDTPNH